MCWRCADSWAGVDRAVPFKLCVAEQTRASREGRIPAKPKEEADAPEDAEDRDPDEEEEEEEEDEGAPLETSLHSCCGGASACLGRNLTFLKAGNSCCGGCVPL